MKRNAFVMALVTAGAILLSGCGSTDNPNQNTHCMKGHQEYHDNRVWNICDQYSYDNGIYP